MPSDQSDAIVAGFLYVSSIYVGSDLIFKVFCLTPSASALSKRSTRAQMFSLINILNCLPPLLAVCVLKHVCTRLIILTANENSNKIKRAGSGQLAMHIWALTALIADILFIISKNDDWIDCQKRLYGGGGSVSV